MNHFTRALALGGVLAVGTACISQNDFNRLQIENDRLATLAETRRIELERAQAELLKAKVVADTHEETADIYKDWVNRLESQVTDMRLTDVTVHSDPTTGTSQINLANTILFDSGSIEIKPNGLTALSELATTLKEAPGILRIEGHTDSQPVKSATVKQHSKDNWQLSVNRSLAVLRHLLGQGVPPEKLSVVGYGQHHPLETNGPKGNRVNRRVEILFVPGRKPAEETPAPVANEPTETATGTEDTHTHEPATAPEDTTNEVPSVEEGTDDTPTQDQ